MGKVRTVFGVVAIGCALSLVMSTGAVGAAVDKATQVFVTNDAAHPVPVAGTVGISGTPRVHLDSNQVEVTNPVAVGGTVAVVPALPAEPFQAAANLRFGFGSLNPCVNCDDQILYDVPDGKVAVIQHVSVSSKATEHIVPQISITSAATSGDLTSSRRSTWTPTSAAAGSRWAASPRPSTHRSRPMHCGRWVGRGDVAVDLMVIPAQANTSRPGARAARIPPHDRATARVTPGLEPALVDHRPLSITALEPTDSRTFDIRVAGPAALLVAKVIKIGERLGQSETRPDRLKEKDALDAFRILQAVSTADLVAGLRTHRDDANARPVSAAALRLLSLESLSAAGVLPRLAAAAALDDPTVAPSFVALAEQLVASAEADGPQSE